MAERGGVNVFILSVTRDTGDPLGAELAEALSAAGHALAGRDIVHPDADAASVVLGRRLADARTQALVVAGGCERWGQDAGSRAVAKKIARPIAGFAELYRALVLPERGAAALLDDVQAGYTEGRRPIFALPDDPATARAALERLVLPVLAELVARADAAMAAEPAAERAPATPAAKPAAKPAPARPAPEEATEEAAPTEGLSVTQMEAPKPNEEKEELASGWEAGLRALGGELRRSWPVIPDAFERLSAALDVLNSAGQRGEVLTADGRRFGAFAFPDFNRPEARVLLVAEGEDLPEVIALHRHPRAVGTVVEPSALRLPTLEPAELATRLLGRPAPGGGALFAVEGEAVHLLRERRVWRWDGRKEQDQGTPSQALASLMLRWAQR